MAFPDRARGGRGRGIDAGIGSLWSVVMCSSALGFLPRSPLYVPGFCDMFRGPQMSSKSQSSSKKRTEDMVKEAKLRALKVAQKARSRLEDIQDKLNKQLEKIEAQIQDVIDELRPIPEIMKETSEQMQEEWRKEAQQIFDRARLKYGEIEAQGMVLDGEIDDFDFFEERYAPITEGFENLTSEAPSVYEGIEAGGSEIDLDASLECIDEMINLINAIPTGV
jgi:hypothetical protein